MKSTNHNSNHSPTPLVALRRDTLLASAIDARGTAYQFTTAVRTTTDYTPLMSSDTTIVDYSIYVIVAANCSRLTNFISETSQVSSVELDLNTSTGTGT